MRLMESLNLDHIWKVVLGEIEVELGKNNCKVYFKNSQLTEIKDGVARLNFLNKAVCDQVNLRYYSLVQGALQKATNIEKLSLVFGVAERETKETEGEENVGPLFVAQKEDKEEILAAVKKAHLRQDFTFDEFCVSTSNQLPFAAAQAVALNPGKNYNPLFLWGGVGVGKTHLMQAIGHEILRKNPKARVIFAPGEQFTNEIVAAIRNKGTAEFKDKYRKVDALLIDDIQFFSGKETSQDEFFHTFNEIQQNEGQIVMTSDRKPADIRDLTDRLRSRFEGGLVADISTPDTELKTAICIHKASKRGIELSNVLAELITANVDNIRTLDGELQKIIMVTGTKKMPITEDLIREILGVKKKEPSSHIDARTITDQVCEFYDLPMKVIKGEKRDKPIAVPRQILMYLLRKKAGMTLEEIADYIGGRDHTTIMHGIHKVELLLSENERIRSDVHNLEDKLK